jgi:endoglycosylceramidase
VRLLGLLALVLLFAAPAAAAKHHKRATRTGAPAGYRFSLPRLHADPDSARGGRIVDARGREVLLRGVNVNALAEYWKGTPFATTFPLAPDDPDRMATIGWDAVRLLVSWSRIEPQPGAYDEGYLDQVAAAAAALRDRGLYSIVDFHQDAWGPTLVAPDGTVCPPPSEPAIGWDGAPGWATLDGGLPRCFTSQREINPAVHQAWQSFLADDPGPGGVGVQTRYVQMIGHVARRFAAAPWIAGYDLMNEPNAFGPADEAQLSGMYGRAFAAIRANESAVSGGFPHLVLFEPSALWSAIGRGAPPDFAHDSNVVYAPHIYTGGFDNGPITRDAFQVASDEARGYGGVPVLSGEWGSDPGRAKDPTDLYFPAHQAFQDEFQFGATLWTWRESCGDPHKVGAYRAGQIPGVWGEFDVDCHDNRVTGTRDALIAQLRRGYVRAAPGRLDQTKWDLATRTLSARGTAPASAGDLVAFYPGNARLDASGLRNLRHAGDFILASPSGGSWSLTARP